MQLSTIDARIMRNVTGMQQLEIKLEPVSAHDYRSILLPLVKSYLRVYIKEVEFVPHLVFLNLTVCILVFLYL